MIHRLASAAVVILAVGLPLSPESLAAQPPAAPRYFICPVTTELHRQLVPAETDLCVVMDTSAAVTPAGISADDLKFKKLRTELSKQKVAKTRLHFHLFYGNTEPGREEEHKLLHYAAVGLGHDMGFRQVTASE